MQFQVTAVRLGFSKCDGVILTIVLLLLISVFHGYFSIILNFQGSTS